MMASIRVVGGFRPYQLDKGAGKDFPQSKGRGKDQKGKGKERTASETPNEEGFGEAWESDDWSAAVTGLMVPGLQMQGGSAQGLILHGWWQPR